MCRNVVNSIGPQPIVFLGRQMRDALFLRESHDRETESRPETLRQISMIFGVKQDWGVDASYESAGV